MVGVIPKLICIFGNFFIFNVERANAMEQVHCQTILILTRDFFSLTSAFLGSINTFILSIRDLVRVVSGALDQYLWIKQ